MRNILDKFRKPMETQEPQGIKRIKTIPPHVVACKLCEGRGNIDGHNCEQCKGSGRVIVTCDVTTYVTAYEPEVH